MDGATALNGYGWLASLGVGGVLAGGRNNAWKT